MRLWSFPEGKLLRTFDFGRPTRWQVGPGRLLAETFEGGSVEEPGISLLRAWELPDGEPVELGRVDGKSLGTSGSLFTPDGKSWLYFQGRDVYARPLPVGTGSDRLFARLGAEVADFWTYPDRLILADGSGETHVWTSSPGGLEQQVIPRPDTASQGMLPDPSGRWLAGDPGADREIRLWDLGAWKAARPISLRRSGFWYGAVTNFHPEASWVVASTAFFTKLTFWPLVRTYPVIVDGYQNLSRPLAFSPDGKWLATSWRDEKLRLWPLPGSGENEVRLLELPEAFLVRSLAFDPKGRYLFAVGGRDRAWIVPLEGSAPRKLHGFSEDTLLQAGAVSPSGRFVATAFNYGQGEKTLRVWNTQTGALRSFELPESSWTGPPTGYERGIVNLAFEDDSTLYTSGDGGLRRWSLESGSHELLAEASPGFTMLGPLRPESGVALTVARRMGQFEDCSGALVHDLTSGSFRELTNFGECGSWRPSARGLDPTGTVLATRGIDGIVRVGRLSGGTPHLLVGHRGTVDYVAISPDLRWVATTGEDHTLRLWPMPDLSKPPLHTLPREELLETLRSVTNLRAVRDPSSPDGWKVEVGPFPGWKNVPSPTPGS